MDMVVSFLIEAQAPVLEGDEAAVVDDEVIEDGDVGAGDPGDADAAVQCGIRPWAWDHAAYIAARAGDTSGPRGGSAGRHLGDAGAQGTRITHTYLTKTSDPGDAPARKC